MLTLTRRAAYPGHCALRAFVLRDVSILNKLNFERFVFILYFLFEMNSRPVLDSLNKLLLSFYEQNLIVCEVVYFYIS